MQRGRVAHLLDHARIGGARDAAVGLDVGRDALERHDRDGARRLGDARLLAVDDVHDHATLLEDREGAADGGVHLVRVRVRVRVKVRVRVRV